MSCGRYGLNRSEGQELPKKHTLGIYADLRTEVVTRVAHLTAEFLKMAAPVTLRHHGEEYTGKYESVVVHSITIKQLPF